MAPDIFQVSIAEKIVIENPDTNLVNRFESGMLK